jgi:HD superfamily phosphodiesterase
MIEKIKDHYLYTLQNNNKSDWLTYEKFVNHVPTVEWWAMRILETNKEADEEIIFSAVWLHDIGHLICEHEDHAVDSEIEARRFLQEIGAPEDKIKAICHAVRSHRCKDVFPETIEAKILAAADSASHFTSKAYFDVGAKFGKEAALGKLNRDYRDIGIFPELRGELEQFYVSWEEIISVTFE